MAGPRHRLGGIEAARGVAACAVVLYHASRHVDAAYGLARTRAWFHAGHAGVDLFFVISGFIILFVHHGDVGAPHRLGRYAARRASRVLPAYWVALAVTLAMIAAGHSALPGLWRILASAVLLPSDTPPILGVAWTLQYEIVFYTVFAVLIASRRAGQALFALWALAVLAASCGLRWRALPVSLTASYNLEFFLGLGVAWLLCRRALPAPQAVLAAGIAAIALAILAEDGGWLNGYTDGARLIYGAASAAIIAGLAEASRSAMLTPPAWLIRLGRASYAIYLFQFVGIGVLWQIWQHLPGAGAALGAARAPAAFLLLAVGGIGFGMLASATVEQPLLRLLRPSRPAASAEAA